MDGTVRGCKILGYTDEQANLMGEIDDLFERAIKVGLVDGDDVIVIGQVVGTMALKHTGKQKLMNLGVDVKVLINNKQVV